METKKTKSQTVNLRTSEDENEVLKQAAEKLSQATGEKPNISKAIIEAVQEYQAPYFYNRLLFNSTCQLHQSSLKHYQSIADSFLLLNFGPITLTDLQQIEANNFGSIQKRFFDGIEQNISKLNLTNDLIKGNLRIGTSEPYDTFKEKALKSLDSISWSKKQGPPLPLSIQNYTLKNGEVTFTDEDRKRIKNKYCVTMLDTPSRIAFAKLAESTFENLKELKKMLVKDNSSLLFGRNACFDENDTEVFYDRETLHYVK